MMQSPTFQIFPWQQAFLPALKEHIHRVSHGRPGSVLLIVPHNRPWRYLLRLYAEEGQVSLLPKVLTLTDMVTVWRSSLCQAALHTANVLDRVALLHDCVHELAAEDSVLSAQFSHMTMEQFLPWGMRLAAVLEELLSHGLQAPDLAYAEYEVSAPAASLLGALGRISQRFLAKLAEKNWTTPALDLFTTAAAAQEYMESGKGALPHLLQPGAERPVLVAGFSLLTATEETLLKALWQEGAQICLHTDPAILEAKGWHWACDEQHQWLRRWQAKAEPAYPLDSATTAHKARTHFFAGYDVHSQLQAMRDLLQHEDGAHAPSTAVVLINNDLLMPVLHHLPQEDTSQPGKGINVSMGYPLSRSPLSQLLESIFRLHEKRQGTGSYYWRTLLQCLRHPYLNMLEKHTAQGRTFFLRPALRRLEKIILNQSRYVDLQLLLDEYQATDFAQQTGPELTAFLKQTLELVLQSLADVTGTAQLAEYLSKLCLFLEEQGGDMWEHFPLDREAMYRLMYHVIPLLRGNSLATQAFDQPTLFALCREVMEQERVPFEAEPLTGLQVLGLLETRLLHFERVLIMDATDDLLPGKPAQDPLLPDSLRQVLGLTHSRNRERAVAYNLYRLCAGATDVHFFWQEGIQRSSLFDAKKEPSRFVEQLIWQEEQKRGALLRKNEEPLFTAPCHLTGRSKQAFRLENSPALRAAMTAFLQTELSPTRLDTYLRCPLQFVWQHLGHLAEVPEVNEGDDYAAVGNCIHKTLERVFANHVQTVLRQGTITLSDIMQVFTEEVENNRLEDKLPADSFLLLLTAAQRRFSAFLEAQPEETTVLALEKELKVRLELESGSYAFTGTMDRLDRRMTCTDHGNAGFLHVLDYKTGSIRIPKLDWTVSRYFLPPQAEDGGGKGVESSVTHLSQDALEEAFSLVQALLPSLQLPCYIAMLQTALQNPKEHAAYLSPHDAIGNAALVDLKDTGRECHLFNTYVDGKQKGTADFSPEEMSLAVENCRMALDIVLSHMQRSTAFVARAGKHCDFCPFRALCAALC